MTSSWVCWADMPVLAIHRASIMGFLLVAAQCHQSLTPSNRLALLSLVWAVCSNCISCSNWRAAAIMPTLHSTGFTFQPACQQAVVGIAGRRLARGGAKLPVAAALQRVFGAGRCQLEPAHGLRRLARHLGA